MEKREIKFKGLYECIRTGDRTWTEYGIGTKPMLTGAKWLIEDLQWTGLKDSKGKDIYEDDIIKISFSSYVPEHTHIVEWQLCKFVAVCIAAHVQTYYQDKIYEFHEGTDCEVTGNRAETLLRMKD